MQDKLPEIPGLSLAFHDPAKQKALFRLQERQEKLPG